jgi:hypothetical protein
LAGSSESLSRPETPAFFLRVHRCVDNPRAKSNQEPEENFLVAVQQASPPVITVGRLKGMGIATWSRKCAH